MHPPEIPDLVADAFGRPAGATEGLQRFPEEPAPKPVGPGTGDADPWRDPLAAVRLGEPALPAENVEPEPVAGPLPRFTLRDALFHRRLRPGAVIGLLVLCLVVGAGGAAVGVLVAQRIPAVASDPDFTLTPVQPAIDRPTGSVAEIAARVSPAVVSIEVRVGDTGDTGSGVVIDGNGYILTNNHVISTAATDTSAELTVVFHDETRVPATIVGRDIRTDLAVLKVDVDNLTVIQVGDSSALRVGDPVIAIGSPLGLEDTVTTGIISALARPVRLQGSASDTNAVIDALQTDAAINPGNSGGALLDGTGALIGINTAIRTLGGEASGSIGLGFAIPMNLAREVAESLIRTGTIQHPTLGVNTRSATDGETDGAQVQNVVTGGPAAAAGIQEGDVIVKVGDRDVQDADELAVAVQAYDIGQAVPVVLERDGRTMTVTVTLAAE
ncbi:S1C family serine protease [Nakamurella alba]|nr:trypsin-like peptidase domain-containing protein [Nakamurella alba]